MRKGERPSNKPTLIPAQKLKVLSGKIVKKLVKLFLNRPHTHVALSATDLHFWQLDQ